ncbi:MAG: TauD/TfdA family dioxygenase [Alphaproteobacteria bacterium]|nr:TauD/TfdA family dioxygenase [Alphaproteobacteria bacterium]
MTATTISIQPLSAHTGAEISGVDLGAPLDEATFGAIRRAFSDWGVIFFRDQDITPAQQLAFARRFGQVEADRHASNLPSVDGFDEIKEIVRRPEDARNVGGFWHTDQSFLPHPDYASVLYARTLPPIGGDTMFAHLGAALKGMSPGLRATLETLSTVHIKSHAYGIGDTPARGITAEYYAEMREKFAGIEATHPVIARHPDSGREVLFLGPVYSDRFDGWTREESLPLMRHLAKLMTKPEHTCRFRWSEGSLAMWDNRAVLHYAFDDYPGHRRVMHRATVSGPWLTPLAAAA